MSGCQVLSSGLRRALGEERHFTLVDGFALPTAGFCTGKNPAFPFFGRLVSVVRDGGHQSLQVYRSRTADLWCRWTQSHPRNDQSVSREIAARG